MQRPGERAEIMFFGSASESQGATVVLDPPSGRADETDGEDGTAQQAPGRSGMPEIRAFPPLGSIQTVADRSCGARCARSYDEEEEEDDMEYFDDEEDEDDLDDDLDDDVEDDLEDEEDLEEDEDL